MFLSRRSYPQVAVYTQQLNVRMKVALSQARRGNKQQAIETATKTLTQYAILLLNYTWRSRVKQQLTNPIDLTQKQKETFIKQMVDDGINKFQKIINDIP
jgi:hypothetical protein